MTALDSSLLWVIAVVTMALVTCGKPEPVLRGNWAKPASPATWLFIAPDAQSEPAAMLCGGVVVCKDHVVASFDVGTSWKRYVIRFADMARRTSGAAAPRIDLAHVYGVEWQFGVSEGSTGGSTTSRS